ncbi:MAG TPA: RhuM family protein [Sulfuricella sp.]|nr:RhuM family protein [Sulfuricella sp.]HUX62618.1 RhuM family protein [Sulfuricella sp.]
MNDIVIFEADSQQVEVRLEGETLWLSLQQLADLFGRDRSVISRHLKNTFETNELERDRAVAKNATVQREGEREVVRQVEYFNLDAIISVGYRVNSTQATRFRQWATRVLREHLTQGFSINEYRLAQRGLVELEQTVNLLSKTLTRQELVTDIGREVVSLILGYAKTWRLLLDYDEDKLGVPVGAQPARGVLGFEEARRALDALADAFKKLWRGQRTVCPRPGRGPGGHPRQYRADHVWRPAVPNPRGAGRPFALFRDQESPVFRRKQALRGLSVPVIPASGRHAPHPG